MLNFFLQISYIKQKLGRDSRLILVYIQLIIFTWLNNATFSLQTLAKKTIANSNYGRNKENRNTSIDDTR